MPSRHIYITRENDKRLEEIENKSGLINQLIEDYFEKRKTPNKQELLRMKAEIEFKKKIKEIENGTE